MAEGGPLFLDVTWHVDVDSWKDKETNSTHIAAAACNYVGIETMLHMACCNATETQLQKWLRKAKNAGIRNILALRGGNHWTYIQCLCRINYHTDMEILSH